MRGFAIWRGGRAPTFRPESEDAGKVVAADQGNGGDGGGHRSADERAAENRGWRRPRRRFRRAIEIRIPSDLRARRLRVGALEGLGGLVLRKEHDVASSQ